ncbi:hypothetical protein ABK040_007902 [Willaertia magna]
MSANLRIRIADNSKIKEERFLVVNKDITLDQIQKQAKQKLNLKKKIVLAYDGSSGKNIETEDEFQQILTDNLFLVFSTNAKQTFQGKIKTDNQLLPTMELLGEKTETTVQQEENTDELPVINNAEVTILIKDSWLDDSAIKQLEKVAKCLKNVKYCVGEPDLHPGKTFPVGCAISTSEYIYPPLVGNDIGCGMALFKTNLNVSNAKVDKYVKQLNGLEVGGLVGEMDSILDIENDFYNSLENENMTNEEFLQNYMNYFGVNISENEEFFGNSQLGTIGGGNHFAELQVIEKIIDEDVFYKELNLDPDVCYLMVHSGSRGYGDSILREHEDKYGSTGFHKDLDEAKQYMLCHDNACKWARANRALIARKFLSCISATGKQILDVCHNNVESKVIDNESLFIHRKGAAPCDKGVIVIPGSRGSYSYLVRPKKEDEQSQKRCNYSAAHGAGRKHKRSKYANVKGGKQNLTVTELGSRVICEDNVLLYEEQPSAYKDIDQVIKDLEHFNVVSVVAILKPLITYKVRKN